MPDPEPATPPQTETSAATNGKSEVSWGTALFGVVFWGAIALIIAWNRPAGEAFLREHWLLLAAGIAGLIVAVILAVLQGKFRRSADENRVGMIIFILVPSILLMGPFITLLPPGLQPGAIQLVFFLCVCMLPPTLYYLFITTRKVSLLNEYVSNLVQLGLTRRRDVPAPSNGCVCYVAESCDAYRRRLITYLQKFEAVHGALTKDRIEREVNALMSEEAGAPDGKPWSYEELRLGSVFGAATTIPVVLATVLTGLGWLVTLPPLLSIQPGPAPHFQIALSLSPAVTPVHFAFLGAYFFSLQMIFRRYVRRDLRASAYSSISLRIILAVMGAWVIMGVSGVVLQLAGVQTADAAPYLLAIGFAIGVFPPVIWQFILAVLKRITFAHRALPSMRSDMPISDLDGLTIWHEARFEEEDIENIPNMASADIVELLLNTRVPPGRIIDWVDEAILFSALGTADKTARERLRRQGVYTASGLVEVYYESEKTQDRDSVERILECATGRSPIRSLIVTLQTQPNLRLIYNWRGLAARDMRAAPQPEAAVPTQSNVVALPGAQAPAVA